jgi:WD40 repeat protein
VTRLVVSKKHVEGLTFTPDGGHLVVVCNDKVARLYDVGTWTERQTLDFGIGGLRSVVVAPDGSRAAAGSTYSGKVVIWDLD